MTELEKQIVAEAKANLPIEIKFAVDDPARFNLRYVYPVLIIHAVPGFLYERLKRPELRSVFERAVFDITGKRVVIEMSELSYQSETAEMYLEALSKPPVPEPEPERKFIDYFEWMKSPAWRRIRNRKMKESGYKCELCGSAKNLHVHHITYENIGHEPMDDLLVVCNKCHKKLHEEDFKKKGGH